MFYAIIFSILGIALVVIVLSRRGKRPQELDPAPHHQTGTGNASHTASGSHERQERKRRRAQSRHDRRKRH